MDRNRKRGPQSIVGALWQQLQVKAELSSGEGLTPVLPTNWAVS